MAPHRDRFTGRWNIGTLLLSGDLKIQADPLLGLVNPLGDLVTFGILVAAGYWYRHRSDIHKRLMLLATVGGLMPAPLAHLIGHSTLLREMRPIILVPIALLLFASAVFSRTHPIGSGAVARRHGKRPLSALCSGGVQG
jgi:hypothetical protein